MGLMMKTLLAVCATALAAPLAATATTGAAAAAATTPATVQAVSSRSLACTQTTVTRPMYRRSVSGTVNGTSNLLSATVIRLYNGKTDIATTSPVLDNTFWGGYWMTHYGWNTWLLGTVPGGSTATYYLMLPSTPLPTGTAVNGLLFINYNNGLYGNNQFAMSCVAN